MDEMIFPEVFYELFREMPRQGPGSNIFTRKAYELLPDVPRKPEILDIGCGSGMQTLELARISGGKLTALDNYQPFLDTLDRQAKLAGLDKQVETVNGSMFELPFDKSSFDVIWSEGAIFIIGFEKGLREWQQLLRPGGYLVVSELCWLQPDRPEAVRSYMAQVYPAMKDIAGSMAAIRDAGYRDLGNFILPEAVWLDDFYQPMQSKINILKTKYAGDAEALELLRGMQTEIDMYQKYRRYYGYIYYIMQVSDK